MSVIDYWQSFGFQFGETSWQAEFWTIGKDVQFKFVRKFISVTVLGVVYI